MTLAVASEGLGKRAVRGTAFSLGGQLVSQVLRLASNLLLTRLLDPDAFGLMAIVLAVTTGLQLISDVGIWQAIVRSPRGDEPDFQNTAWTLTALRGIGLFAIGCLVAWPAAEFYGRAELLWLLPLCTFQAFIQGLESTKMALAVRKLMVGRVIIIDIATQVVALSVSLPVGYLTRSVLALVVASLVSVLVRTLLSHLFVPGARNRLRWDKSALQEIFSFGGWIFVSTLLYFVGTRWDVFALGKLESMAVVGVYGLAQMITQVPVVMGEKVAGFVLMPALAERFRDAPHELAGDVRRARLILYPAAAILFLGAAMTAPAFFDLLYRDVYADAGWMTQLLVLVGWCSFLQDSSSRAVLALGDSRSLAVANAVRLIATIALTSLGFQLGDHGMHALIGFMLGNACGSLVGAIGISIALGRHGVPVLGLDLAATAAFVVLGVIGCGLPHVFAPLVGVRASLLSLVSVVVILGPLAAVVAVRTRHALRAHAGPA